MVESSTNGRTDLLDYSRIGSIHIIEAKICVFTFMPSLKFLHTRHLQIYNYTQIRLEMKL